MIGAAENLEHSEERVGDLTPRGCCCYVLRVRGRVARGRVGDLALTSDHGEKIGAGTMNAGHGSILILRHQRSSL